MRKVICFFVVVFAGVLFSCHAQVNDYDTWRKIVNERRERISNGTIRIDYSFRKKDSVDFVVKPFTITFSKEISYSTKRKKIISGKINAMDEKDSVQFIGTPNSLTTIDHKKKTFEIDTFRSNPLYFPYYLLDMADFYLESRLSYTSREIKNQSLAKNETSIILSHKVQSLLDRLSLSNTFVDSVNAVLYTQELSKKQRAVLSSKYFDVSRDCLYEFSLQDTILTVLVEKVENERIAGDHSKVEEKSTLTFYHFNSPQYDSDSLYNYKNFTQGYTHVLSFYQQLEAIEEKFSSSTASAPLFELPVLGEDKIIKLEDYKGKWVLLNFWDMTSVSSADMLPKVEKVYGKYHTKSLEMFTICRDIDAEHLQNVVKERKFPFTVLFSKDEKMQKSYGVYFGYPTFILINPEQKVVVYKKGIREIESYLKKNVK